MYLRPTVICLRVAPKTKVDFFENRFCKNSRFFLVFLYFWPPKVPKYKRWLKNIKSRGESLAQASGRDWSRVGLRLGKDNRPRSRVTWPNLAWPSRGHEEIPVNVPTRPLTEHSGKPRGKALKRHILSSIRKASIAEGHLQLYMLQDGASGRTGPERLAWGDPGNIFYPYMRD